MTAALGPLLVRNADRVNLRRLDARLTESGLQRRLAWVVANVLHALRDERARSLPRQWAKRYRRAEVVLGLYIEFALSRLRERPSGPVDILDAEIRSKRTLAQITASSSEISREWGIITSLQPDDFIRALRAARADG